jgi:hypothetical protein
MHRLFGSFFGLLLLPRWLFLLLLMVWFAAAGYSLYVEQVAVGAVMIVLGAVVANAAYRYRRMQNSLTSMAANSVGSAKEATTSLWRKFWPKN